MIALVVPKERLGALYGLAIEEGGEAYALHGLNAVAVELVGVGGTGELDAGGHDVDEMGWLTGELACLLGSDAAWPVSDEWGADTAFMLPVFVFAEGCVADIGPAATVADVGISWAGHDAVALADGVAVAGLGGNHIGLEEILGKGRQGGAVSAGDEWGFTADGFGAATIVLEVEDEGVLELAVAFESIDQAADALVHAVEHCGIDLHAAGLPGFVFDCIPIFFEWWDGPMVGYETELPHFFDASLADRAIAEIVAAFVFGDVGRFGVHGPVGGGVGDVEEKGLVRLVLMVLGDEACGVVVDGVGVVIEVGLVVWICVGGDEGVVADEGVGIVKAACAVDGAVEAIESALQGPIVAIGGGVGASFLGDVPFADHVGSVASGF